MLSGFSLMGAKFKMLNADGSNFWTVISKGKCIRLTQILKLDLLLRNNLKNSMKDHKFRSLKSTVVHVFTLEL